MRVPIEKVPLAVRRRAARALATLNEGHMFPRGRRKRPEPTFGAEATPIYRPDLDDVAYWEIELEGVQTALPLPEGEATTFDRGFIIVATGGHDVPVPHFSLDLAPPGRQLEARGGDVARIVKLDALCYAAEDAAGALLGHLGTMPPKLEGVPVDMPRRLPEGWAITTTGDGGQEDGERGPAVKVRRSREERPVKLGEWGSWEEVKEGYAESYRLQLDALATRASQPWRVEELTAKFGQGIRSGEPFTVLLLEEGKYELSGPGAEYVSAELNPQPLPPRLVITGKADSTAKDTTFEVRLSYAGAEESLLFFVVPQDAPSTVEPTTSALGPVFGGVR